MKIHRTLHTNIKYNFSGELWKSEGQGGWYFVSLPNDITQEIRNNLKGQEEGWGRMKAIAKVENIEWNTAIWFDRKRNTYLLPIKADIRKKGNFKLKQVLVLSIFI